MLTVTAVTIRFGVKPALDHAGLVVEDHSIVALMGPSGSGKSTLLRAIAGLERPDSGDITWNGRSVLAVPAHRRGFGLMFQDYALFPHRDVAGNVAFGLRMQGVPSGDLADRVAESLDLVGLPGYEQRSVGTLSGGERQRVALARTLAPRPGLVLLDEPLGALDRSLREHLLVEMRAIFERVEATVLYVTHDRDEAFAIADRVAIIRDGRIVIADTPEGLWRHPPDAWSARFVGLENLCAAETLAELGLHPTVAGAKTAAVPPESITVSTAGRNAGVVSGSHFRGGAYRIELCLFDGSDLVAWSSEPFALATTIGFDIDADRVHWFTD